MSENKIPAEATALLQATVDNLNNLSRVLTGEEPAAYERNPLDIFSLSYSAAVEHGTIVDKENKRLKIDVGKIAQHVQDQLLSDLWQNLGWAVTDTIKQVIETRDKRKPEYTIEVVRPEFEKGERANQSHAAWLGYWAIDNLNHRGVDVNSLENFEVTGETRIPMTDKDGNVVPHSRDELGIVMSTDGGEPPIHITHKSVFGRFILPPKEQRKDMTEDEFNDYITKKMGEFATRLKDAGINPKDTEALDKFIEQLEAA